MDDLTGEQLAFDNIILQYSQWEKIDEKGYLGFDCHGGGKMTYITKGKAVDGTWTSFGGEQGAVRYFDSDGRGDSLKPGQDLIEIIQDTEGDKVSNQINGKVPVKQKKEQFYRSGRPAWNGGHSDPHHRHDIPYPGDEYHRR